MANKKARTVAVSILALLTVAFASVTVYVGTRTPPNVAATALLQGLTLVLSVLGPYIFARYADSSAATESLKTHARPAFRRTRNIYHALGRYDLQVQQSLERLESLAINVKDKPYVDYEHVKSVMLGLSYALTELVGTANDALQDWHDLVPDEVDAIMTEAQSQEGGTQHD